MAEYRNSQIHATPVAEGVRFQIGNATAFAVRNQNRDLSVRVRRERRPLRRKMAEIPFVRGILRLILAIVHFLDGISESAELEPQQIARGTQFEQRFADLFRVNPVSLVAFESGLLIPIIMLGLMLGVPAAVESLLLSNLALSRTVTNAILCAVRVSSTLLAIRLVAHLRVMNRFCMYRGAINKVLNAYARDGSRITHESAVLSSRIARKSDAAFITLVVLISIVAFACVRTYTLHIQVLVRILLVLAIAAIINEPLRLLENVSPRSPYAPLLAPVMWLEHLFVIEPHNQMVEVALCAFNAARKNDV